MAIDYNRILRRGLLTGTSHIVLSFTADLTFLKRKAARITHESPQVQKPTLSHPAEFLLSQERDEWK